MSRNHDAPFLDSRAYFSWAGITALTGMVRTGLSSQSHSNTHYVWNISIGSALYYWCGDIWFCFLECTDLGRFCRLPDRNVCILLVASSETCEGIVVNFSSNSSLSFSNRNFYFVLQTSSWDSHWVNYSSTITISDTRCFAHGHVVVQLFCRNGGIFLSCEHEKSLLASLFHSDARTTFYSSSAWRTLVQFFRFTHMGQAFWDVSRYAFVCWKVRFSWKSRGTAERYAFISRCLQQVTLLFYPQFLMASCKNLGNTSIIVHTLTNSACEWSIRLNA